MRYPVTLTRDDNDTIMATFPDVPEAVTFGATEAEALERAPAALLTIFDAFMKDERDIPEPSVRSGPSIALPPDAIARIEFYRSTRTRS